VEEEDRKLLRYVFLVTQDLHTKINIKLSRIEHLDRMLAEAIVTSSNSLPGLSKEKNSTRQQLLRKEQRLSETPESPEPQQRPQQEQYFQQQCREQQQQQQQQQKQELQFQQYQQQQQQPLGLSPQQQQALGLSGLGTMSGMNAHGKLPAMTPTQGSLDMTGLLAQGLAPWEHSSRARASSSSPRL
jgi:hypothetical protein